MKKMNQNAFSISKEMPKKLPFFKHSPPLRRISVSEYHKMGEAGIFSEDERIELIDGVIIEMSPIGSKHAAIVKKVNRLFSGNLPSNKAMIGIQDPVILDDRTEPQPDVTLLKPRDDAYASGHPRPEDILLIVEVADTTVEEDRTVKLPRYAACGIPEMWLVNIPERKIEAYHTPVGEGGNAGYKVRVEYREGDTLSPDTFPNIKINVAEVLS